VLVAVAVAHQPLEQMQVLMLVQRVEQVLM
jgi:hypothetical protein